MTLNITVFLSSVSRDAAVGTYLVAPCLNRDAYCHPIGAPVPKQESTTMGFHMVQESLPSSRNGHLVLELRPRFNMNCYEFQNWVPHLSTVPPNEEKITQCWQWTKIWFQYRNRHGAIIIMETNIWILDPKLAQDFCPVWKLGCLSP